MEKFEPIGFDGHYNPDLFQNFLLIDFLDDENKGCSYICNAKEWYLKFLGNENFLKIYKKKINSIII